MSRIKIVNIATYAKNYMGEILGLDLFFDSSII